MCSNNDYLAIKEVFSVFVKAWEMDDYDKFDECLRADCMATFSIFGAVSKSRDALKAQLRTYSKKTDDSRFNILNYFCLVDGNRAFQSAGICGTKCIFQNGGDDTYCFTSMFSVIWNKTDKGWRICDIKCDLLTENWRPINSRAGWFVGASLPVIVSEYDASWMYADIRLSGMTNEEQIEELYYKYCFAVDSGMFGYVKKILTEDAVICLPIAGAMDKRTAINSIKLMRQKTAGCTHHLGFFKEICVNGDRANAKVCHVLNTDCLTDRNSDNKGSFDCPECELELVKKDGTWLICTVRMQ